MKQLDKQPLQNIVPTFKLGLFQQFVMDHGFCDLVCSVKTFAKTKYYNVIYDDCSLPFDITTVLI